MTTIRKALKTAKPAKRAQARVTTKKPGKRRPASAVLAAVHDSVAGLHRAGLVKAATMREFDALCLAPVVALAPSEIAALRRRGVAKRCRSPCSRVI